MEDHNHRFVDTAWCYTDYVFRVGKSCNEVCDYEECSYTGQALVNEIFDKAASFAKSYSDVFNVELTYKITFDIDAKTGENTAMIVFTNMK